MNLKPSALTSSRTSPSNTQPQNPEVSKKVCRLLDKNFSVPDRTGEQPIQIKQEQSFIVPDYGWDGIGRLALNYSRGKAYQQYLKNPTPSEFINYLKSYSIEPVDFTHDKSMLIIRSMITGYFAVYNFRLHRFYEITYGAEGIWFPPEMGRVKVLRKNLISLPIGDGQSVTIDGWFRLVGGKGIKTVKLQ